MVRLTLRDDTQKAAPSKEPAVTYGSKSYQLLFCATTQGCVELGSPRQPDGLGAI